MHVRNRVTALRLAAGLSQAQLAKELGVAESSVYRWEIRETEIRDKRKGQLAAFFGVTIPYLMCHHGSEPQPREAEPVA
jgi:transcriptional regulator with XRE-family HTH domain